MLPGIDGLEVCRAAAGQGRRRARDHADRARLRDRPGGRARARCRRLRDQALQPARAGAAGRLGAAARRRAGRRRVSGTVTDGDLVVDSTEHTATLAGRRLALTAREFDLLRFFLSVIPARRSRATSCSSRSGAGRSVTSRRSPCTSGGCARRSRPIPPIRCVSRPCGASATDGRPRHDPRPGRRSSGPRQPGPAASVSSAACSIWLGPARLGALAHGRGRDGRPCWRSLAGTLATSRAMFLSTHDLGVSAWSRSWPESSRSSSRWPSGTALARWSRDLQERGARFGESGVVRLRGDRPGRVQRAVGRATPHQRQRLAESRDARARPGAVAPRAGVVGLPRPADAAGRACAR